MANPIVSVAAAAGSLARPTCWYAVTLDPANSCGRYATTFASFL